MDRPRSPRRAALALGVLGCLAGCVAPPSAPPPALVASPPAAPADLATSLVANIAASGTVLPPRIERIAASLSAPDGTEQTTPVLHASFPEVVFFDFDRDALWPNAGPVCDALTRSISDSPGTQVTIVGHTDAIGTDDYNLDLSRRRALAVMQALIARGVDPARLSAVAVGKRQPIAPDDTPQGRAENRRVDFFLSPSLQSNLAAIAAVPGAAAPDPDVAVLRPAPDPAVTGGLTLAAVGTLALRVPAPPPVPELPVPTVPEAAPATPQNASVPQTLAPAVQPATPAPQPRAVPRTLAPEYLPRTPGDALSY